MKTTIHAFFAAPIKHQNYGGRNDLYLFSLVIDIDLTMTPDLLAAVAGRKTAMIHLPSPSEDIRVGLGKYDPIMNVVEAWSLLPDFEPETLQRLADKGWKISHEGFKFYRVPLPVVPQQA